ncbi:CCA tRNA nucleotidyltransferase [Oceanobacillus massiliensis]|uniref:CCA tRNA nucleotidyltransferase n=1 Tax=Oceanobacillus massiliensis TaxID=1465765 RepID=UPI00301982C1
MLPKPFAAAKPVLEQIEKHNYRAYFVGGCVRDLLLDRALGDIDIATSAPPETIQKIFPKVIPVGIEHGTVIVRHEGESYEVTTFRLDGDYSDKRHPDTVQFINEIDKDLERRDFTINALAMDLDGDIIDLFGGRADIEKKVIQTVGDGYKRFTEDALRIIRALRFTSQLGFTIHPKTLEDMRALRGEIESLAVERITNEFTKLFAGVHVNRAIEYLKELKIGNYLPVFHKHTDLMDAIPSTLLPLCSFGEVISLFHLIKPEVSIEVWVRQWKVSNKIKMEAQQLLRAYERYHKNGLDLMLVYQLDPGYYDGFVRLVNVMHPKSLTTDEMASVAGKLEIRSRTELAINGHDLIEMYPERKKGPWLHRLIQQIEAEVAAGNVKNNLKDIKDWIKWNPHAID